MKGKLLSKSDVREKILKNGKGGELDLNLLTYTNQKTPISCKCKKHGTIEFTYSQILQKGYGLCGGCRRDGKLESVKEKFRGIHGDRFSYKDLKYNGTNGKLEGVFCKEHGYFNCSYNTHLTKDGGCKKCKIQRKTENAFKSKKERYEYLGMGDDGNLKIRCKKHGEVFYQSMSYHKSKWGECPICVNKLKLREFIKKAKEKHGNKYDYSRIEHFHSNEKVEIVCKEHGIFEQTPTLHLKCFCACPECSDRLGGIKELKDLLRKFKEVHGDLYDYSKVNFINVNTSIDIICNRHGIFKKRPYNHLKGEGCKKCLEERQTSKSEIEWCNSHRVPLRNYLIGQYNVDGFNDETNTVYEFLGDYWHGNLKEFEGDEINKRSGKSFKELNEMTFNRLNQIKEMGYTVIYIWESDWKDGKKGETL